MAFAVPACLLFAVLAGFWMTPPTPQSMAAKVTEIQPPGVSQNPAAETKAETKTGEAEKAKDNSPKIVTTLFTPSPGKKVKNAVRAKYRIREPKYDTLTSEERFAYDQLKLALSITGSKLKVVSDTINRAED